MKDNKSKREHMNLMDAIQYSYIRFKMYFSNEHCYYSRWLLRPNVFEKLRQKGVIVDNLVITYDCVFDVIMW